MVCGLSSYFSWLGAEKNCYCCCCSFCGAEDNDDVEESFIPPKVGLDTSQILLDADNFINRQGSQLPSLFFDDEAGGGLVDGCIVDRVGVQNGRPFSLEGTKESFSAAIGSIISPSREIVRLLDFAGPKQFSDWSVIMPVLEATRRPLHLRESRLTS